MNFARTGRRLLIVLTAIIFMLTGSVTAQADRPAYKNPRLPVDARVADLLRRMTLAEKIYLVYGNEMETHPIPRLGIPSIHMTDGPIGVRWDAPHHPKSTSFPPGIAWASAFDPRLVHRIAQALAVETRAHGRDMLLGPCVNISRAPQGGRNFESYGEDPLLAATYAAAWVRAMQEGGVIACVKHFALNEQETERTTVSVVADDRALHEIHLPAFLAAVQAGTKSIMASYNRIDGVYASENNGLLNVLLKGRWRFPGFVVSDWGATHSTIDAANHGLDLEMPQGDYFGHGKLRAAVRDGKVKTSTVDDKVRRILRVMFEMGLFDHRTRPPMSAINSPQHKRLAREAALEGMVLLKNNGLLPLTPGPGRRGIALIGPWSARANEGGGGSSKIVPAHAVTPLEAFKAAPGGFTVRQATGMTPPDHLLPLAPDELRPSMDAPADQHGLRGEYFANQNLEGTPVMTRVDPRVHFDWGTGAPVKSMPVDHFSVRWSGVFTPKSSGKYRLGVQSDDGSRLYLDNRLIVDDWRGHAVETHLGTVTLEAGHPYPIRLEYYEDTGEASVTLGRVPPAEGELERAVNLARHADVAIVFVGWSEQQESEGQDRQSLTLPFDQDVLVERVAAVNPHTVVVVESGGSTLMPWLPRVAAVVQAWYPGEQGAVALADLLLGRANFGGKLPVSFYRREEDASSYGNFPGQNGVVHYAEGIFVGYRFLDAHHIAPLFPFGYGLSYTRFALSNERVQVVDASHRHPVVRVSARVTNRGPRAGAEVVQLYVHDPRPALPRPPQELKGFQRINLRPGESRTVTFTLTRGAFAWYDPAAHAWATRPGRFTLNVGTSSRDIHAELPVRLQ